MHNNPVVEIHAVTESIHLQDNYEELLLNYARQVSRLQEGLATRKVIGQAIGLLMAEYQLSEDAAFEVLRRRYSYANIKLRDIAQAMVDEANSVGQHMRPVADC